MNLEMKSHPLLVTFGALFIGLLTLTTACLKSVSTIVSNMYHLVFVIVKCAIQVTQLILRFVTIYTLVFFVQLEKIFKEAYCFLASYKPEFYLIRFVWAHCFVFSFHLIYRFVKIINEQLFRVVGCGVKLYLKTTDFIIKLLESFDLLKTPIKKVFYDFQLDPLVDNFFKVSRYLKICEEIEKNALNSKVYFDILTKAHSNYYDGERQNLRKHENYSWWGLVITKLSKLLTALTMITMHCSVGLIASLLNIVKDRVKILKYYSKQMELETTNFYNVLCEKTGADKNWVESLVSLIMIIPNTVLDVIDVTLDFILDIFDLFAKLLMIPAIVVLNVFLTIGHMLEQYFPSCELYDAKLYKPEKNTLQAYKLSIEELNEETFSLLQDPNKSLTSSFQGSSQSLR